MNSERIVIGLLPFEPAYREKLQAAAPEMTFVWAEDGPVPDSAWQQAVIILGNPTPQQIAASPNLRWVQLGSAGADAYCRPGVLPETVQLTNATGSYGHAISEYMVGVTLMLMKKLHLYRDYQLQGQWQDAGPVRSVSTAKVLVVGMGDIGGQYAQRMSALGAQVTGITRTTRAKPAYAQKMATLKELDQLLPDFDVVALSLPNSPETAGLMDARRLGLMKKNAILLNVGRGSAVDTEALCEALENGRLGGAGLDVTDPEPLPAGHRLWQIPNAFITPHTSGGYHMRETYETVMEICLENMRAYLAGRPLGHQVDRQTGYMKK